MPKPEPTGTENDRRSSGARSSHARPRERARSASRAALRPAKAALTPARAAAEIVRYWYAERNTLRQGMVSLSISALGNIPTGLALGAMTGRLEELPGLFILIPAAIGMRGAIFGALGSRLGTAIQAGILRFTRDPGGLLMQNIYAATLLTFTSSLFLAVAARIFTQATGLASISVWDFVAISVLAGVGSSIIILAVTVWLASAGSRRGWDLDSVAAPIITFVGDLITLPALFLASFVAAEGGVTLSVAALSTVVCVWAGVMAARTDKLAARRIIRESAITLALAGVVNLVAGTVVEHRAERFFAFPALFIMLPSFLENAGALGGIVSSRLASKLHLGSIRPRFFPERLAALDISLAGPWSLLNFAATGLSAHYVAEALGKSSPGAAHMTGIALLAGVMATAGAAVVAYATAVATFRFDLDPDNHGIAAVTSTMDLIGVICIVVAVSILGVS
jgi:mgtE-like transporter